jgi:periplasmic protein TonB
VGQVGRVGQVGLALALSLALVACGARAKPAAAPAPPPPTPPSATSRSAAETPRFVPNPPPSFIDAVTGQLVSGPGVTGPRAVFAPSAEYTDAARRDRITGTVVMSIVVDATGRVESASVARPLRDDLDASALTAIRTWRFEPAQNNGKTAAAKINVEMTFNLK